MAFITLYVDDIEGSTVFYRDVMGLRIEYSVPGWIQFSANGAGLVLQPKVAAQHQPNRRSDLAHIGFQVDDVEAEYERLSARRVKFKAHPAAAQFGKQVTCLDPEGNEIDLVEWKQASRPPVTRDTRVNDIIAKYPETMEVFENHGIRICGGCLVLLNAPVYETAEYSGLDANESLALLRELNQELAEIETPPNPERA